MRDTLVLTEAETLWPRGGGPAHCAQIAMSPGDQRASGTHRREGGVPGGSGQSPLSLDPVSNFISAAALLVAGSASVYKCSGVRGAVGFETAKHSFRGAPTGLWTAALMRLSNKYTTKTVSWHRGPDALAGGEREEPAPATHVTLIFPNDVNNARGSALTYLEVS